MRFLLALLSLTCFSESTWTRSEAPAGETSLELRVESTDGKPLPARVVIRHGDRFLDGGGKGVYADGRFYIDGTCELAVPTGQIAVDIHCGPSRWPLSLRYEQTPGTRSTIHAKVALWRSATALGWYCGDNHVHAQHDAKIAAVHTDLPYTALQARAEGLDYMTEAGSHVAYIGLGALSSRDFLFRYAPELRPGIFAGHLITPGIPEPLPSSIYEPIRRAPLPVQNLLPVIHKHGGTLIHTHVLMPRHQLHWMGAGELLTDMVHRRCADAIDLDSDVTELLYFTALNLGNRIAVSSYTDAALGRAKTLSPGQRRVYTKADSLDYAKIVAGIRDSATFATNGGPLYIFLDQVGRQVSGRLLDVEVASRHSLKSVDVIHNGVVIESLHQGQRGSIRIQPEVPFAEGDWALIRAEDQHGNWAITSPAWFQAPVTSQAASIIVAINNTRRSYRLSERFFLHAIVSVSPELDLSGIAVLKDGKTLKHYDAAKFADSPTPVTAFGEDYADGVAWVHRDGRAIHVQLDHALVSSGQFEVRATTRDGRVIRSDGLHFRADYPNSHQITAARVISASTEFVLHGYGEELPIADIPNHAEEDRWWYPKRGWSDIRVRFGDTVIRRGHSWTGPEPPILQNSDPLSEFLRQ